jgi:competence protein ComEC
MKLPVLSLAICLAAGILAAAPITAHLPHGLVLSLLIALGCVLVGCALLKLRRANLAWTASLLAWFSLGAAAAQIERLAAPINQVEHIARSGQFELDEPLRWRGILRADPLRLPWGVRYDIDLEQVQATGRWTGVRGGLRASYFFDERTPGNPTPVRAGERVELLARARLIRNFGDPGAFDYRAALEQQGIDLTATLRNPALMQVLPGPAPKLSHFMARLRGRLLNELDAMLAPAEDRAAIARAMLLGDRSFLDSQQIEPFRETGVYHVLVLAGLHVDRLFAGPHALPPRVLAERGQPGRHCDSSVPSVRDRSGQLSAILSCGRLNRGYRPAGPGKNRRGVSSRARPSGRCDSRREARASDRGISP